MVSGGSAPSSRCWVLAAGVTGPRGVGAAMVLSDTQRGRVHTWKASAAAQTPEHAALIALIQGLAEARARGFREVAVYTPFDTLEEWLNRKRSIAPGHPLARCWMRARALSHQFDRCEFHTADVERLKGVLRLAAEAARCTADSSNTRARRHIEVAAAA